MFVCLKVIDNYWLHKFPSGERQYFFLFHVYSQRFILLLPLLLFLVLLLFPLFRTHSSPLFFDNLEELAAGTARALFWMPAGTSVELNHLF